MSNMLSTFIYVFNVLKYFFRNIFTSMTVLS